MFHDILTFDVDSFIEGTWFASSCFALFRICSKICAFLAIHRNNHMAFLRKPAMLVLTAETWIWVFPKIMVPPIIHFNRVFHYFHHPFWGPTPIFGSTPICLSRAFSWELKHTATDILSDETASMTSNIEGVKHDQNKSFPLDPKNPWKNEGDLWTPIYGLYCNP